MASPSALLAVCALFAAVLAVAAALPPECKVEKLVVCAPAVIGGAPPTQQCCSVLKEQQGCFCIYAHDPSFRPYINSPTDRKAITSCGIPLPTCTPTAAPADGV